MAGGVALTGAGCRGSAGEVAAGAAGGRPAMTCGKDICRQPADTAGPPSHGATSTSEQHTTISEGSALGTAQLSLMAVASRGHWGSRAHAPAAPRRSQMVPSCTPTESGKYCVGSSAAKAASEFAASAAQNPSSVSAGGAVAVPAGSSTGPRGVRTSGRRGW